MKKVLFTATVDSHILQFHLPFLKYFKDKGYEVHVATNGNETIPFCDKKISIPFERSPFKINNISAIRKLRGVINEEKYDLIHTHTPMGSVVTRIAANKTRRKNKTKVIYTAHGFHFYKGASIKNWVIYYSVEKILSRITDAIITINNEDYELAKKRFKKARIYYVPGVGIDTNKFNIDNNFNKIDYRKKNGFSKDDILLIYPAELSKRKNQSFLIKIMSELIKNNDRIHLLLPGKDSMNGYHKSLIEKNGLSKNIHLLGYRNDISSLLKMSDIAVSSAYQEGLPVNIMEAIYTGLPIVALDARGVRDLLNEYNKGIIIYNNDEIDFINGIYKSFNDKEKEASFDFSKYSIDNIIEIMDVVYNEVLYESKD